MPNFRMLLTLCLVSCLSVPLCADEAPAEKDQEAKEAKADAPKETKITGVLEAAESHEVQLKPESWTSFKVEAAPLHGAMIRTGDLLLQCDPKDLDRKLDDSRRALDQARLAMELAEREFETARQILPLDIKSAERTRAIVQQDLDYFEAVTLPQSRKSAERSLMSAEYRLEYVSEELKQLEQMYKADDLTEQTEEIILIRSRRDVEDAKYLLDSTKIRTERTLSVDLPRQREQMHLTSEKQMLETEKSLRTLELGLERKRHELDAQRLALGKLEEDLAKLKADRDLMSLKSPAGGYVYYGQQARGKWTMVSTLEKQLRPGGAVTANQVFLTIVNPDSVFLRIDVPEAELHKFEIGTKGHVVPTALPDLKIEAEISELSFTPIAPGTFDGKVTLKLGNRPARLMPGMACSFVVPEKAKE